MRKWAVAVVVAAIAIIAAALLISGFVPGTNAYAHRQALSDVADQMFDPSSAQFRKIVYGSYRGKTSVCGQVNAKNRMGAYVGYSSFIYIAPDFYQQLPDEGPVTQQDISGALHACAMGIVGAVEDGTAGMSGMPDACSEKDHLEKLRRVQGLFAALHAKACPGGS